MLQPPLQPPQLPLQQLPLQPQPPLQHLPPCIVLLRCLTTQGSCSKPRSTLTTLAHPTGSAVH